MVALLGAFCAAWGCGHRQDNFILNGDLTKGSGSLPDHWTTTAFDRDSAIFRWNHTAGAPGELELYSPKPNDAAWCQVVHLAPGWYHLTVSARAEDVLQQHAGVYLSSEGFSASPALHGTTGWQTLGFYMKVGLPGADIIVGCRLGGFSNLNTGTAFCRDFRATKVDEPPAGAGPRYDLNAIRGGSSQTASGWVNPITLVLAAILIVAAIAFMTGRHEAALVVFGAVCFVCLFTYPIIFHPHGGSLEWDWQMFLGYIWVQAYSVTHFHQLPLWNPYACGGMPLLANPSSQVVTPLFILLLSFGFLLGLHLQILVYLAIAWIGGYLLAKSQGMGVLGRLTCASVFPSSTWFYLHLAGGATSFMPAAYLPWIALFVCLGVERRSLWPWIAAGLVHALIFCEGGVYPWAQAVILVGIIVLYATLTKKSLWPIEGVIVFGVFAMGFAAVKLLPSWHLMQSHPRTISYSEYYPVRVLLQDALFKRNQYYNRTSEFPWFFDGAYLSPISVALAVLGLLFSIRRAAPWLLAAVLFFTLAIGDPAPWYPWALHHWLPVFSQQRTPIRFLVPFTLSMGVLAGFGVDFLSRRYRPLGAILASLLLAAAVADGWLVSLPNLSAPVGGTIWVPPAAPRFRQEFGSTWQNFETAASNTGSIACNEAVIGFYDLRGASNVIGYNQPGYFGEQYLIRSGSVTLSRWTPNALSYDVDTPSSNVLVVNENYDPNWRLAEGKGEVFPEGGLIGVRVPSGAQHLKLVYRSYLLLFGAALTLLTWIVAFVVWRRGI